MNRFSNIVSVASLAGFFLLPAAGLQAEETILQISADQMRTHNITTAAPSVDTTIFSPAYPAEISIANNQVSAISPLHAGVVTSMSALEGMRVDAGDVLAEIASPEFLEEQRLYLDAVSAFRASEINFQRDLKLFEEGIISEKRRLDAQLERDQAANKLRQAETSLKLQGLTDAGLKALATGDAFHKTLSLKAPFAGEILTQTADVGDNVTEGEALYTLGQMDALWVRIHVPADMRPLIATGAVVRLVKEQIAGKVLSVGRMIHGADQGILVTAEIREGTEKLIPGQFTAASIALAGDARHTLKVPRQAVIKEAGKHYVFVKTAAGFSVQPVTLISEEPDFYGITGDITASMDVAVTGIAVLKGMVQGLGSEE
ncbi:hypothetical protein GCM10017044_04750 [Kordiimonas sediminis]|uniref:CzcB-like barrel-sandwich hybrid domain-containing protein n=1 Tax=Kordiimonas sediminis TaxID=1735581 RepID=A0A919E519_9PROT|nr:efflux RND transporter periplasmic adaptor subunit [Kordiimonas sediminis]GHF13719.1 hypothetical protein GCM10017044_04750 [Kordiimonas sediminis]